MASQVMRITLKAYDSLLFFTSHKYSDCWMYVFSVNSGKHIASLCPKGQGPNDYLSCKNSQQFIRENGELKLWVRDNAKSARLLNITKSIETGATVCDAIIPMDWNKYFVYPAIYTYISTNRIKKEKKA